MTVPVTLHIRTGLAVMGGAAGLEGQRVDVSVFIDGVEVLKNDLQYEARTKSGRADFEAVLTKQIDLRKSRWLQVNYFYHGKDASGANKGELEMTVQDRPFYYR